MGPPNLHRSIKRKETAGVLGEGEEGDPGFVAENQLPHFGNHSFPEVSLPFRPAQTDNLPPLHGLFALSEPLTGLCETSQTPQSLLRS